MPVDFGSATPGDLQVGWNGLGDNGNIGQYTSIGATDTITILFGPTPLLNQEIILDPEGLPLGLTSPTIYYVVNPIGNTFQLATTPGGTPIDFGDGGGVYTLGDVTTGTVFIGGAHGYIEKIAASGTDPPVHISWLECRDTPVTGNLMEVWGIDVGPDGAVYSALIPMTGGPYNNSPQDVFYILGDDTLAVIIARTDDTAFIRIVDPTNGSTLSETADINTDPSWDHTIPLKLAVSCDGETAYYTDQGRTIFRYDLQTNIQLSDYWQLPADDPNCFGDLDILNDDRIIVNMTITGHGPRRALALESGTYVWADRINPPDGIHRVWKIRVDNHTDVSTYAVALTPEPNPTNDEITALGAFYGNRCVFELFPGARKQVNFIG